jgi:Family of unknown function (DUF5926)/SEC-C motif
MGKQARLRAARASALARTSGEIPAVASRQPCPCGSGLKYKDCHGRTASRARPVGRPFEGLASEGDWIALREFVPAATAPLTLTGEYADERATVCTVLPGAYPALRRDDGSVLVAMQTQSAGDDPSKEVARALVAAISADPGTPVDAAPGDVPDVRLQEVLDPGVPLDVTVHEGFDFWVDSDTAGSGDIADALERANAAVVPTRRLSSVDAAYWCAVRDRNHLRWVMPYPERETIDALARLHAAGESSLGVGTRFVGSFRAYGLLVPVWDLPQDRAADGVEEPAAAFAKRLGDALAVIDPLTAPERRARDGLLNRQLTIR